MGLKDALAAIDWESDAISAEEAVALIPPAATVYIGGGCAVPESVVAALEAAARSHPATRLLHHLAIRSDGPFSDALRHRSMAVGPHDVELARTGRAQYIPIQLTEVPFGMFDGRIDVDVAVVVVSPPDARGMCSLGISVDVAPAAIAKARIVIAEINPAMPKVRGPALVPYTAFDAVVAVERPLATYSPMVVEAQPGQIARYVARLVTDGATLQIGPGRIPNEVLRYLDSRRDLGIHSDVITDSVIDLIDAGVITGRHKATHRGRVVAALALGSEKLYDRIADDDIFALKPIDQIAGVEVLARQHRLVSIMQASTCDLTGQVCAEARDGAIVGGVGVSPVFQFAAAHSPGGRAIICMPSLDAHGRTTIRAVLDPIEAVTIPRFDVRWIVTEYGAAFLHGKTLSERAVALIEIAHPDHRVSLLAEAQRLGLVPPDQKLRSRVAYPVEEERSIRLRDGRDVLLRPTQTTDAPEVQALFYELKPEDVYTRFFRNLSSLTRQAAEHLCSVSYTDEMAFAAAIGDVEQGEEIVATSSYFVNPDTGLADVAYMIRPDYQGVGLGSALHARTIEYAKSHGVRGFTADVLETNPAMMRVFSRGPGHLSSHASYGVVELELLFDDPPLSDYTTSSIQRIAD